VAAHAQRPIEGRYLGAVVRRGNDCAGRGYRYLRVWRILISAGHAASILPSSRSSLTWDGYVSIRTCSSHTTAVGKSFIRRRPRSCRLLVDFSVRCFRLARLVEELARFVAMQKRSVLYLQLAKPIGLPSMTSASLRLPKRLCAIVWKFFTIATIGAPRSSRANYPSISGTPISATAPLPMLSSIVSCSKATPCASNVFQCPRHRRLQDQKLIDE